MNKMFKILQLDGDLEQNYETFLRSLRPLCSNAQVRRWGNIWTKILLRARNLCQASRAFDVDEYIER